MTILGATFKDEFRKPSTGMWNYFLRELNTNMDVDKTSSFFCGDAAGRPKTATTPKDFSADDLKFANNVGLKFHTPDSLFLNKPMTGV